MRWFSLIALLPVAFVAAPSWAQDTAVEQAAAEEAPDSGEEGDPLAELAALGDAMASLGPEGGGSIRAKRDVDPKVAARRKDKRNLEARVESVKVGGFPTVALRIKVTRPAKSGPGKSVKRNSSLVIVPAYQVSGGQVALKDPDTLRNAGAFYLKSGDRVLVRLADKPDGKLWRAEYIERK